MALKSFLVSAMNRFPGQFVSEIGDGQGVKVTSKDGELLAICKKVGGERMEDVSKEYGAKYDFSRAPIPRNVRVWKLAADGTIKRDEEAAQREPVAKAMAEKYGRVLSIDECEKEGLKIEHEHGKRHRGEVKFTPPQPKTEQPKAEQPKKDEPTPPAA